MWDCLCKYYDRLLTEMCINNFTDYDTEGSVGHYIINVPKVQPIKRCGIVYVGIMTVYLPKFTDYNTEGSVGHYIINVPKVDILKRCGIVYVSIMTVYLPKFTDYNTEGSVGHYIINVPNGIMTGCVMHKYYNSCLHILDMHLERGESSVFT